MIKEMNQMSGMRSRTIKAVLERKMSDWIGTITDQMLQKLVRRDTIVTGGCITSMLLGEDVNDFDVYFKTRDTAEYVAAYYATQFARMNPEAQTIGVITTGTDYSDKFEEHIIGDMTDGRVYLFIQSSGIVAEKGIVLNDAVESVLDIPLPVGRCVPSIPYRPIFFSSNAITLSDKIQLVMRFTGDIGKIHDTYDFVHTKCHYDCDTGELVLPPQSLECILSKQLIYTGSKYPLCSIIRTRKFIQRGWHITAGEYIKMIFQASELDLKDINVLADQLVGVDSAYFTDLIIQLKEQHSNDSGFHYGAEYISKIVDIVFNGKVKYE